MADAYFEVKDLKLKRLDLGDGTYAEAVALVVAGAPRNFIGTHGNAWAAAALTATASAPVAGLDISGYSLITLFGRLSAVTGNWDLNLEVSQDGTNWFRAEELVPNVTSTSVGDGFFEKTVTCAARFVRLELVADPSGGITVTATLAAKRQ